MKNLSLILNGLLILAVAHLYYLNFSNKTAKPVAIKTAAAAEQGVKIAYVNMDTIDAKYEWLKTQRAALESSQKSKESSLKAKQATFMKDMEAFQAKYQAGTTPPAELEKQYNVLMARQQKLVDEEERLGKQLSEEYKKAMDDLMANVETQLKNLQSQIGYDFILSYTRGGGNVLLANDSLEITNQVLDLLNTKQE
ncbi:MAG: OmpH family outer membrane protein [Lewinellaceae bacterium]|nr:OmpH family outer membrane protein [Lewinellaceae bacterium]